MTSSSSLPEGVTIRLYEPPDHRAILDITSRSFEPAALDANMEKKFGLIAGTTWQDRKLKGVDIDLRRQPEQTLVAVADGKVVGYVSSRASTDISTGHIANLAVAPDWQGHALGKALIQAALDRFREVGLQYARIETLEQNDRGKHIYPTCGFEEIGRQRYYMREL
jgi:ribosomal protein S18 acetylase RimI-like enzyme